MLTLETLKSMVSSGDLSAAPTLDLGFSQGAALIRRRLETLSSVALRVARAKAVAQGDLNVHALAELIEMSPLAVAEGLEELQRAQVLSGEHFVHDLICEAVLAGIPETLAQVLHERAALLLAQMPHKPEHVAHHWLRAGDGAKAAPYLLQAALSARQIRADKEARHRYFQALWCLSGDSASDKMLRRRALKGLGTLADLTHDFRAQSGGARGARADRTFSCGRSCGGCCKCGESRGA